MPVSGLYIPNRPINPTAWALVGAGSLPVDTDPPTVPGNPTSVAASKTQNQLRLTWTASTDADSGVFGYEVSIDTGPWIPVGLVLTWTFAGLLAGTPHTMRVRARDNATNPSAAATVVDTTTAAPNGQPSNVHETAVAQTSITWAWNAPTAGTVVRYEWRINSGTFASVALALTKQVTGLTADTPYTFGVRAVFADGTTSAEVTDSARTSTSTGAGNDILIGLHVGSPPVSAADATNNPDMATYLGQSQLQNLNALEAEMRTLGGWSDNPLMQIGHVFMSGSHNFVIKPWGTTQLARMPACICNFKPNGGTSAANMATMSSGADNARMTAMIGQVPTGKTMYAAYFHEPDELTSDSDIAAWRAANVAWAKFIIANRGTKKIIPIVCLTTFSFRSANAATQAKFLRVEDDYDAAGVDWQNEVVMAPDGYEDKSLNGPDAAGTFIDVFPVLAARGWKRFGITETATSSRVGSAGGNSVTAADVANSPAWAQSLLTYGNTYKMEYICWFNATGSKGPVGSFMHTDALKKVWGDAAHNKGTPH